MNARILLSWVDFWTVTVMWKSGQNEAEHSTWMQLMTEWKDRSPCYSWLKSWSKQSQQRKTDAHRGLCNPDPKSSESVPVERLWNKWRRHRVCKVCRARGSIAEGARGTLNGEGVFEILAHRPHSDLATSLCHVTVSVCVEWLAGGKMFGKREILSWGWWGPVRTLELQAAGHLFMVMSFMFLWSDYASVTLTGQNNFTLSEGAVMPFIEKVTAFRWAKTTRWTKMISPTFSFAVYRLLCPVSLNHLLVTSSLTEPKFVFHAFNAFCVHYHRFVCVCPSVCNVGVMLKHRKRWHQSVAYSKGESGGAAALLLT